MGLIAAVSALALMGFGSVSVFFAYDGTKPHWARRKERLPV